MTNINLEKFSGPLDLLLELIDQEKLVITEISLAQVTDQFFQYLNTLDENRSEELADFLVIATKLVYIKSRQLLPYLYPQEDEGESLADQLKFYKRYADASKVIEKMWGAGKMAYARMEPKFIPEGFSLPLNATGKDLHSSILLLLKGLKPIDPLPQVKIDRAVSVREKVKAIYDALNKIKNLKFKDILDNSVSRTDVIVSFLALLELVKSEKVAIQQENAFNEMVIRKI